MLYLFAISLFSRNAVRFVMVSCLRSNFVAVVDGRLSLKKVSVSTGSAKVNGFFFV